MSDVNIFFIDLLRLKDGRVLESSSSGFLMKRLSLDPNRVLFKTMVLCLLINLFCFSAFSWLFIVVFVIFAIICVSSSVMFGYDICQVCS